MTFLKYRCYIYTKLVFSGMHLGPAEAKRDRRTDRQTEIRMDERHNNPWVALCFAGVTKTTFLPIFACKFLINIGQDDVEHADDLAHFLQGCLALQTLI